MSTTNMEDTKETEPLKQSSPDNKSAKQFEQLQWYLRPPPPSPGLLPVAVDTIITNFLQFTLTVLIFLVIFTSFTYDGDNLGWIIFAEIVILLISFPFYVKYICKNVLIWDKFFRRIDGWYSKQNKKSKNDSHCRRILCINVAWWLYSFLVFPVIICYSAFISYKWYKNQRTDTKTDVSKIDWDSNGKLDVAEQEQYIKHAFNTFNVSYLGYLSKQGSCLMVFIQDLPLLIISAVITNYLGLVTFSLSISWKLFCWFKHMYDVRGCRAFYKFEDFWDHYQLFEVKWIPLEDPDDNDSNNDNDEDDDRMKFPVPKYYTDDQKYKSRLRLGDMVKILDKDKDDWILGMVYKNCYHQKKDLIVLNWDKMDHTAWKTTLANGEHYTVPDEVVMKVNRWDDTLQPLNEKELQMLENDNDDTKIDQALEDKFKVTATDHAEMVELARKNSASTGLQHDDTHIDNKQIAVEIEKQTEVNAVSQVAETKITIIASQVSTVADDDKKSDNQNIESIVSKDINDDNNENNEQLPLIGDDGVIVDIHEINPDGTVHQYQSVPLNDNI